MIPVLLYLRGMERDEPDAPHLDETAHSQADGSQGGDDNMPFRHPLSPSTEVDRRPTMESIESHITYTDGGRPQEPERPVSQTHSQLGLVDMSLAVRIVIVTRADARDTIPQEPNQDPRHLSNESWGNLGPLPDSQRNTFGYGATTATVPFRGQFNFGVQPPAAQYANSAANYALPPSTAGYPPRSSVNGQSFAPGPQGGMTINLTILPPTEPASRTPSHAPSRAPSVQMPPEEEIGNIGTPSVHPADVRNPGEPHCMITQTNHRCRTSCRPHPHLLHVPELLLLDKDQANRS